MMAKITEVFQTPRLTVRHWLDSDLEMVLQVYGDQEIIQWVGDRVPLTHEQGEKWLEVTKRNYEKHGYGMFAIIERDSNQTIGFGGLVHPDNSILPELKYAFLKSHWGKGFASEFVQNTLVFAQESLKMKTVIATTYPENLKSIQVLLKSGFTHEKDLPNEDGTTTCFFRHEKAP